MTKSTNNTNTTLQPITKPAMIAGDSTTIAAVTITRAKSATQQPIKNLNKLFIFVACICVVSLLSFVAAYSVAKLFQVLTVWREIDLHH